MVTRQSGKCPDTARSGGVRTQFPSRGAGTEPRHPTHALPGASDILVRRPTMGVRVRLPLSLLRIVRHVPAGEGEQIMASVTFDNATRLYPGGTRPAVDKLEPGRRRRRVPRPRRPVRLRKVHLAAHAGRPRRGQLRPHPHRRSRRHRRPAEGPRHRDGLPELRAVPAHDRRREHGLRAQDRRRRQGRARHPRSRGREAPRPRAVPDPQAEGPLRWPASARRHGPRHRASAAGVPHGRAAVEPRREAARADPHPDRVAAAPPRASPRSTSRTTRPRRSPWATASPC